MNGSRFLGREEEFTIKGETIRLKPLPVSCMNIVIDMGDDAKRTQATSDFITETLKRSGHSIDDFDMTCMLALTDAVMKVNGLADESDGVKPAEKKG